jgi:hypothetical protein
MPTSRMKLIPRKPPALLLRRYTDLPATIDLLRNNSLTLLSPTTWDDKNDRNVMQAYVRRAEARSVVALCFSERLETYHHWKIFASGSSGGSGVCINFKLAKITELARREKLLFGRVHYKVLSSLAPENKYETAELPFLKRVAFKDEKEFRLVCPCPDEGTMARSFRLPIGAIESIVLNPWMPRKLAAAVADTLLELRGDRDYKVEQSTLIENEKWTEFANRYA